jgi:Methyltransferase domain
MSARIDSCLTELSQATSLCPVCRFAAGAVVESHEPYQILRCRNCGLQFSAPMRGAAANYGDAYDRQSGPAEISGEGLPFLGWTEDAAEGLPEFPAFLSAAQEFALQLARKQFPYGEQLPALDLGFGAGWFLGALRGAGFHAYGVEIADKPVETLAKKGFAVCKSFDGKIPSEWPEPVLITGFEILEHQEDPLGFLSELHRRYPSADVMLSVPDECRWFLLGGREAHDYPPNHLTRWSVKALELALLQAGFEHAWVWQISPTAQELSMARLSRFVPFRGLRLKNNSNGKASRATPTTTLQQELHKRRLRKRFFLPFASALSAMGKTACSMLALGTNRGPFSL